MEKNKDDNHDDLSESLTYFVSRTPRRPISDKLQKTRRRQSTTDGR